MPRQNEKNVYEPTEFNDQALEKMRADLLARLRTLVLNDAPFDPTTLGPLKPGWNTAVGQLFFLMNVIPDLVSSPSLNLYKPHYPQITSQVKTQFGNDFQVIPVVSTTINPGTLIDSFLTPNALDAFTDLTPPTTSEDFKKVLNTKNGSWLLCGAIGPSSVFEILETLHKYDFAGRVDIVDSGQNTFAAVSAFSNLFSYYYPHIHVNHVKANLLYVTLDNEVTQAEARPTTPPDAIDDGVFLPYRGYDGITADTIGTYIENDYELHMHFGEVFYGLKPGGLAFVRDMARGYTLINPEDQYILQAQKMPSIQNARRVQAYIHEMLGIQVPFEYCLCVVQNMFAGNRSDQEHRSDYLKELWCVIVPAQLAAIRNFAISGSSVRQRWFAEFVFQKE